jgi:hypothetical protein
MSALSMTSKDTGPIADVYVDGTKVDGAALARQFKG